MSLVLEYATHKNDSRSEHYPSFLLPILLTFAHINLCWQLSSLSLVSVCQYQTTHFTAWTPIAWLPGTFLLKILPGGYGPTAMFLMSVLAAHFLHQLLITYRDGLTPAATPLSQNPRAWLTALLWLGWLPLPAVYTFIYHFSQWATINR